MIEVAGRTIALDDPRLWAAVAAVALALWLLRGLARMVSRVGELGGVVRVARRRAAAARTAG